MMYNFLYQKTGFILEYYKDQLHISEEIIDYCKIKTGKSAIYLTKKAPNTIVNGNWLFPKNNQMCLKRQNGFLIIYILRRRVNV